MIDKAAGYLKLVLYISLIICLFLPFGMAPLDGEPIVWMIGLGVTSPRSSSRP